MNKQKGEFNMSLVKYGVKVLKKEGIIEFFA